jgi:hypothetical protein
MWQPIETAPKDRPILLAIFEADNHVELLCRCRMVGEWNGKVFACEMGLSMNGGFAVIASCFMPWSHWAEIPADIFAPEGDA